MQERDPGKFGAAGLAFKPWGKKKPGEQAPGCLFKQWPVRATREGRHAGLFFRALAGLDDVDAGRAHKTNPIFKGSGHEKRHVGRSGDATQQAVELLAIEFQHELAAMVVDLIGGKTA